MSPELLRPGDVLLYGPTGLFGRLIALKTWHALSHVEIYIGGGQSAASRDGLGVAIYQARLHDAKHALRPTVPFSVMRALAWFAVHAKGQPYGWLDLLAFLGVSKDMPGMVCSSFATQFLRAGGVPVFRDEPANFIAPVQFMTSELLEPERARDEAA
jgi:hypothetical protein